MLYHVLGEARKEREVKLMSILNFSLRLRPGERITIVVSASGDVLEVKRSQGFANAAVIIEAERGMQFNAQLDLWQQAPNSPLLKAGCEIHIITEVLDG